MAIATHREPRARQATGTPAELSQRREGRAFAVTFLVASLAVATTAAAIALAPTEATMGHAQRVLYLHVSVAWLSLVGYTAVATCGLMYLLSRDRAWDDWASASAEVGWVCSSLTLLTGSLWARAAWGAWWTWDPRLLTAFVLWSLYGGYLLTRASLDDPATRARITSVLAIVGVVDVPLVVMATRWFRAIHPVSPSLEPAMRLTLILTVLGFLAFGVMLVRTRQRQLRLERTLVDWERFLQESL